jgi:hypothetical protein
MRYVGSVYLQVLGTVCASDCLSVRMCAEWVVVLNRGIPATDLDCRSAAADILASQSGARPTASSTSSSSKGCRVCGGAPEVAAACSANPKCVAFVMDETAPGCGDLKSRVAGQVTSRTQSLYCNSGRGAKCAGKDADRGVGPGGRRGGVIPSAGFSSGRAYQHFCVVQPMASLTQTAGCNSGRGAECVGVHAEEEFTPPFQPTQKHILARLR